MAGCPNTGTAKRATTSHRKQTVMEFVAIERMDRRFAFPNMKYSFAGPQADSASLNSRPGWTQPQGTILRQFRRTLHGDNLKRLAASAPNRRFRSRVVNGRPLGDDVTTWKEGQFESRSLVNPTL